MCKSQREVLLEAEAILFRNGERGTDEQAAMGPKAYRGSYPGGQAEKQKSQAAVGNQTADGGNVASKAYGVIFPFLGNVQLEALNFRSDLYWRSARG